MEKPTTINFITNIIDEDNNTNKYGGQFILDFPQNQMDIFILAMLNLYA